MSYLVQNVNFGGYLEYATILYVAAKLGIVLRNRCEVDYSRGT